MYPFPLLKTVFKFVYLINLPFYAAHKKNVLAKIW